MKTVEYKNDKNIWTAHVIRSLMVPTFCRLELPQPSYCTITRQQVVLWNAFCTQVYNGFILKISACAIMPGFRKSGYNCLQCIKRWAIGQYASGYMGSRLFPVLYILLIHCHQYQIHCSMTTLYTYSVRYT